MCRLDDDYTWMVELTNGEAVSPEPVGCEDCGRLIAAGEPHHDLFDAEIERERALRERGEALIAEHGGDLW